jgi:CubicO group peptidase (beta-lactamase class C family)
LYTGITFFSESYIVENFRSIRKLGHPYNTAHHGQVAEFVQDKIKDLPETFNFKDKPYDLKLWLKEHWTTGLVVLKIESPTKANLLHESYYLGNTNETKTISWSMGKSVVSALIGIALNEGKIKNVNDDVTTYVPQLKNSAYDGVKIKDVLQMSSGVKFNEDYDDFFSDINKMGFWIAMNYDLTDFIKTLKRDKEPGTEHNYISVDTQVLGMILREVTGQSLTSYLEDKLWKKGGFESDCDWLVDNEKNQMELAFGTLNTCTKDYARFGWLYLNKGLSPLDGTRIIDSKWIADSTTISESHLKPNYPDKLGYGYQWWIPGSEKIATESQGDYLAIGVYNQFIYVDEINNIVIAKNSANPNYNKEIDTNTNSNYNKEIDTNTNSNIGELEAIEAFRAIAKHFV